MAPFRSLRVYASLAVAIAAICALSGCAGKKNVWGDTERGLILEYRLEPADVLRYEMNLDGTERVEVMGQINESATNKSYVFTVESKGVEGENHRLGITIESMEASMKNVQGEFSADTEGVIGKSFDMILSRLGNEVDLSGAESIEYGIGPLGERSIESDFQAAFADLAGKPVKVGESWPGADSISIDQGNANIIILSQSVYALDGYQTVEGLECARIAVEVTGTLSGEGEQMGAPLVFDGTLSGTETWYFAYKEGYLVEWSSDVSTDIMVTVQAGQEMKIPVTGTAKIGARLIK
jgi:hypothetical protein